MDYLHREVRGVAAVSEGSGGGWMVCIGGYRKWRLR